MQKNTTIEAIFYYQGTTLVPESNVAFDMQRWLYTSWLGRFVRLFFNNHVVAMIAGWYHNSGMSKHLVQPFIKAYKISMTDFVVPSDGYASFNDFFMRAFKQDVRSLPRDQSVIVSPADSKLFVISSVSLVSKFFIKELCFDIEVFLGDSVQAKQLSAGALCIFRLAPYDYHRFHAPAEGIIEQIRHIHGKLESVNPIAFIAGYQPLTVNERVVIMLKTPSIGTIAIVAVGAMFVGSIKIACKQGDVIERGKELGMFAFGGSTVVVIFPPSAISIKEQLLTHSLQGYETAITMGTAITN